MTLLALRFAGRELRSGLQGFRIFLACLALGVAAIAAAGSTAQAFREGLASHAREILGGDLAISIQQRAFTDKERAAISRLGQTTWSAASKAMAEAPSGERRLVELRGVEANYPLAGAVTLQGAPSVAAAIADRGELAGAAVEQALLERLHLKLGDRLLVGQVPMVVTAVLVDEPDRLSRGFALGPRVLTSVAALKRGGFLEPGLPFGQAVRVALPPGTDPRAAAQALRKQTPASDIRIRERNDAAPGIARLIDQLEYFLSFIGLGSLVAGGLGVFGAVSAFLAQRRSSIAVLKALGADGHLVRNTYLIQIAVLALVGVAIGLAVGAAAPLILGGLVKDQLPVPALFAVYPTPLLRAAAFGLLSAAAFSLAPLGRARATSPSSIFRSDLARGVPIGPELFGALVAGAGLAGLAFATAPSPLAAGVMLAGVAGAFGLLWALGLAMAWLAGKARGRARGAVRIGLANLAGPGSAARTAAPAIGLGVALLAAVVLIQSSLLRQVSQVAPATAPAMVFTDIPGDQTAAFDSLVASVLGRPGPDRYLRAPYVTGRIVAVRGQPVVLSRIKPASRWAYDQDVGFSAIGPEPARSGVVSGRWWPADYRGEPKVAVSEDVAAGADLKIGDEVTVSILGREIAARVAVIRKVDFGSFSPAFALVLDPAALEGAPLTHVAIAKASKTQESALTRALGRGFPGVAVISVREQLEAATSLFDRLALAVRAAASVAALAGLLVLAGAIAARARERTKEAAILKVLGATRGQVLGAYVIEYGLVGLLAGLTGVALGCAAAWPVVVKVFEAQWSIDWSGVCALLGSVTLLSGAGGLAAAFHALSHRPAAALRGDR